MTANDFIAGQLRIFAREFIRNRAKDIVARDLRNTEALLRSLFAKVQADPERGIFFMTVFFRNYGRYQDMRRRYTHAGGVEMEELLKQWAAKEGVGKFRRGRYAGIYAGKSDQQVLNAIAWGIIRKLKDTGTSRKRGWYNRGKERDISAFYDVLLRGYRDAILAEAKHKIENA